MELTKSQELVKKILIQFKHLGYLTSRSMFGGYGICLNKIVFALVSDSDLYLRGNKELKETFVAHDMEPFIYRNRGTPVVMHYYLVSDKIWQSEAILNQLITVSLNGALGDKQYQEVKNEKRLKDLPNLNLSIERLLFKVNILNKQQLSEIGAFQAYLKIYKICNKISPKILFSLAGAIEGCHIAALPVQIRKTLVDCLVNQQKEDKNK